LLHAPAQLADTTQIINSERNCWAWQQKEHPNRWDSSDEFNFAALFSHIYNGGSCF